MRHDLIILAVLTIGSLTTVGTLVWFTVRTISLRRAKSAPHVKITPDPACGLFEGLPTGSTP